MFLSQRPMYFLCKKYAGETKIKKNRIWLATLSRTMRSIKLSRNVSYRSRCKLDQGKAVPSKLSCSTPRQHLWQAWLQELSQYAASSQSQMGNVLVLLKHGCKNILHKKTITMHVTTHLIIYKICFSKSKHWQKFEEYTSPDSVKAQKVS